MNIVVVVVAVVLVVIVLIATGLLLRSIVGSPTQGYRRNLRDIRRIREDIRAEDPNAAAIRVSREDWAGTTDLPG
jgi:uncharacterized protein HemY